MPILEVNLAVQTLIHGFRDDLPRTEEAVAHFLATEGRWDDWADQVPEEYVQRGRSLIKTLLDSGRISGFKDPRTVLLWPFWRRVLSAFPGVRVIPVALLRSPHEIAMSLFTRLESESSYWTCLDVVAVHFRQLQAIIDGWDHPVPRVRFGGPEYFRDLEQAVRTCGLDWNPIKADCVFDESCVHHVPAVITHRAQCLYDSLSGAAPAELDAQKNAAQLEADGEARDRLQLDRLQRSRAYAAETAEEQRRTQLRLDQETESRKLLERRLRLTEERLNRSIHEAHQVSSAYQELRTSVERLKAHPVLGLALKGRRQLRKLVSRFNAHRHAG
jgi:hypothetical protein